MEMDMKKMGFADRIIFILGLTLAGVMTFVLVAGVIVAVLKYYMDNKERAIQDQPSPKLNNDPRSTWGSVSSRGHLTEDEAWQEDDVQERPPN